MKIAVITILILVPVFYIICRSLLLWKLIDPEEQDYDIDDSDFEAEVEALMASRRNQEK